MFWVISVYFNIRNTLPKSGTFILGHLVYIQGDSGGICTTLGNDSMSDSKNKVYTNMGPILNGYGVMGIF